MIANNILIREASPKDVDDIAAVHVYSWQRSYQGLIPQPLLDTVTIDKRKEYWTRLFDQQKFKYLFVAVSGGKTVGFIDAWISKDNPHNAKIEHLYVLKENQGQGIGEKLMSKLLGTLEESGIKKIDLDTLREGPSAKFYEKMGFAQTSAETVNLFGYDVETFHFTK